jgi:hypothetical protein
VVAATVCLVMLGLVARLVYRAYQPGPGIDETAVVTVISVNGGYSGKFGGAFAHRVRLDSGSEATMTFGEIFRAEPGSGLAIAATRRMAASRSRRIYDGAIRGDV